ncbi:MAG: glycogen/starch synthase [Paludibacteraceae bacterium]|nr:glycogen/starch synthase [Paludibacteraceae bacterium]
MPDYIFETSWEVCNRVGGIYAVLSTRAASMQKKWKDKVFFVGPDIWERQESPYFKESKTLMKDWKKVAVKEGLKVRVGRWTVPGNPITVLVDFSDFFSSKNEMFARFWEKFGVDSLHAYGDYDESCVFAYATGVVMESIYRFYKMDDKKVVMHFNEWTTGFGLFYVKDRLPQVKTLFTTHATGIGRSIAGNNKPLYDYFTGYHGDQMARELNMESKHSVEKTAAHLADCFTTVSDITNRECAQLLDKPADIVTPNGFEPEFVPKTKQLFDRKRKSARKRLLEVASEVTHTDCTKDNPMLITISGRYEWKNKGIDVYLNSLNRLRQLGTGRPIIAFLMIPAWQHGAHEKLGSTDRFTTHQLVEPQNDPVMQTLSWFGWRNDDLDRVKVIFVPSYLNGNDGIFNMPYYDLLIGMDFTVFPSYYEPWGYTPLESVAFHIPTLTTNLSGFGQWVNTLESNVGDKEFKPVTVVERTDSNWDILITRIAETLRHFSYLDEKKVAELREGALHIAEQARWEHFFTYYEKAYEIALK